MQQHIYHQEGEGGAIALGGLNHMQNDGWHTHWGRTRMGVSLDLVAVHKSITRSQEKSAEVWEDSVVFVHSFFPKYSKCQIKTKEWFGELDKT